MSMKFLVLEILKENLTYKKNYMKIKIVLFSLVLFFSCKKNDDLSARTGESYRLSPSCNPVNVFNSQIQYGTMKDQDNNVYRTIKIGDQEWMVENLRTTRYRNGDSLTEITDNQGWSAINFGAYCYYKNNQFNNCSYGKLYNWYAISDSRNIAPEGWHVPTEDDWQVLENYLRTNQASQLKTKGTDYWLTPNTNANNNTGFSALPGGNRTDDGYFSLMTYSGLWWTSTKYDDKSALVRFMMFNNESIKRCANTYKTGLSIRCVKD